MNPQQQPVLVWDLPTRLFHWILVICFVGAVLTQESEKWRLFHVTFGYSMVGLVIFRIFWGFVGSRYARFTEFFRSPQEVLDYTLKTISGKGRRYIGHNPLGSVAVMIMLFLILCIGLTGYIVFNDLASEWLNDLHEFFGNLLLAVVGIHIGGVLLSGLKHRENLIKSMITGKKLGKPSQAISHHYWWIAIILIIGLAFFWYSQFNNELLMPNLTIVLMKK